jgi:hypothetical protein
MELGKTTHKNPLVQLLSQAQILKDSEDYDKLRCSLIQELDKINKKIAYKKNLRKIKKEVMKDMIAGPSMYQMILTKKDSIVSKKSRKDSIITKAYYSDQEDRNREELEEAKTDKKYHYLRKFSVDE